MAPSRGGDVRSLVLLDGVPHPPTAGADIRNWRNVQALADLGSVGVHAFLPEEANPPEDSEEPPGLAHWSTVRTPDRGPVGIAGGLARVGDLARGEGRPPRTRRIDTGPARRVLEAALEAFDPDLVLLEGPWFTPFLPLVREAADRVVMDAHNVEGQLRAETAGLADAGWRSVVDARLESREARHVEAATLSAVHQVWACSDRDRDRFQDLYGDAPPVEVVPNTVDVEAHAPVRAGKVDPPAGVPRDDPALLFVGTWSYGPNAEAADHLIDEVLPRVREDHRDVRLLLPGGAPTPRMREAARDDDRVHVPGRVDDVLPWLAAADVAPVPLKRGGGTRLKVLEAFAAGVPVVSTPKGAEGLDVADGEHLRLAGTPDALGEAAADLLADPEAADRLAEAASTLVRDAYSHDAASRRIREAVTDALGGSP